jgi:hypothetical protein
MKPSNIDEWDEREILKAWDWNVADANLPSINTLVSEISTNAANVFLDQIRDEIRANIYINEDPYRIDLSVNLFGGYFVHFDISDAISKAAFELFYVCGRKMWASELEPPKAAAHHLRLVADAIDARVAEEMKRGTLDEQMGMTYQEWEAAGKPDIQSAGT